MWGGVRIRVGLGLGAGLGLGNQIANKRGNNLAGGRKWAQHRHLCETEAV